MPRGKDRARGRKEPDEADARGVERIERREQLGGHSNEGEEEQVSKDDRARNRTRRSAAGARGTKRRVRDRREQEEEGLHGMPAAKRPRAGRPVPRWAYFARTFAAISADLILISGFQLDQSLRVSST